MSTDTRLYSRGVRAFEADASSVSVCSLEIGNNNLGAAKSYITPESHRFYLYAKDSSDAVVEFTDDDTNGDAIYFNYNNEITVTKLYSNNLLKVVFKQNKFGKVGLEIKTGLISSGKTITFYVSHLLEQNSITHENDRTKNYLLNVDFKQGGTSISNVQGDSAMLDVFNTNLELVSDPYSSSNGFDILMCKWMSNSRSSVNYNGDSLIVQGADSVLIINNNANNTSWQTFQDPQRNDGTIVAYKDQRIAIGAIDVRNESGNHVRGVGVLRGDCSLDHAKQILKDFSSDATLTSLSNLIPEHDTGSNKYAVIEISNPSYVDADGASNNPSDFVSGLADTPQPANWQSGTAIIGQFQDTNPINEHTLLSFVRAGDAGAHEKPISLKYNGTSDTFSIETGSIADGWVSLRVGASISSGVGITAFKHKGKNTLTDVHIHGSLIPLTNDEIIYCDEVVVSSTPSANTDVFVELYLYLTEKLGIDNSASKSVLALLNKDPTQLTNEEELIVFAVKQKRETFDLYLQRVQYLADTNKNAIAKLGDMVAEDFELPGGMELDTSATTTETPGLNVCVYVTKVDASGNVEYVVNSGLKNSDVSTITDNTDTEVFTVDEFKKYFNPTFVQFNCYDQNLMIGDGTSNMIQREQILNSENQVLKAVIDVGSETSKYTTGDYYENTDIQMNSAGQLEAVTINEPLHADHIGVNTTHFAETGVLVFTNVNVPYERHAGFTVTVNSSLSKLCDKLNVSNDSLKVQVVVTAKRNNDILSKVGIDVTDAGMASYLAHSKPSAKENNLIVCKQSVSLNSDFDVTIADGTVTERDVFLTMIVDMFRSQNTTLVAPVVVLSKLPQIEEVREALLADTSGTFPLSPTDVDLVEHYMTVSRIFYSDPSTNSNPSMLLDNFHSSADDVKVHSIFPENPEYRLQYDELNGANAYDNSILRPQENLEHEDVGHENVHVEHLIIFTSLFNRTLIDGKSSLTNAYWNIKEPEVAQFTEQVPQSVMGPAHNIPGASLKVETYRKGMASVLYNSLPRDRNLFVTKIVDATIPGVWERAGETYDGYSSLYLLRSFETQLRASPAMSSEIKYPMIYDKSNVNGDDVYRFVSLRYTSGMITTEYDNVSASFAENYFDADYLNFMLGRVAFRPTDLLRDYLTNANDFVTEAKKRGSLNTYTSTLAGELSNLQSTYSSDSTTTIAQSSVVLNRFSVLFLECLHILVNQVSEADNLFDFQPSRVIGSQVNMFKSPYEIIPFSAELSINRAPRNILMEATSLQLKEITFVNNTNLRLAILNPVGNPVELLLPLLLEFKTGNVATTHRKEIEIVTDYLLECLNRVDKTIVSNCVWYTKEEKNGSIERTVRHVGPKLTKLLDTNYESVEVNNAIFKPFKNADDDNVNDKYLAELLYKIMMGDGTTGTSMLSLQNQSNYGRLKLSKVNDDPTARGELMDYRYHGIQQGIFAENVPNTKGGFALQVLRMIKSGLINKPEDNTIIANEQNIVNAIRDEVVDDVGNMSSTVDVLQTKLTETVHGSGTSRPLLAMQNLLDHIYANDKQRFTINETARDNATDTDVTALKWNNGSEDVELYMLPLIAEDTISIITTVNGHLVDPNASANSGDTFLSETMKKINEKLNTPTLLNKIVEGTTTTMPDADKLSSVAVALTGRALNPSTSDSRAGQNGLYKECVNILAAPDIGPYEKAVVDNEASATPDATLSAGYAEVKAMLESHKVDTTQSAADIQANVNSIYQAFRERSFTIKYNMNEQYSVPSYLELRTSQAQADAATAALSGTAAGDNVHESVLMAHDAVSYTMKLAATPADRSLEFSDTVPTFTDSMGAVDRIRLDGLVTNDLMLELSALTTAFKFEIIIPVSASSTVTIRSKATVLVDAINGNIDIVLEENLGELKLALEATRSLPMLGEGQTALTSGKNTYSIINTLVEDVIGDQITWMATIA